MKQRQLFFALSLATILGIILTFGPRPASGRYQATMNSTGTAAAIPACAGIDPGATMPAMNMNGMAMPTSAVTAAATMDMSGMSMAMPTATMSMNMGNMAMPTPATMGPMSIHITSPDNGATVKGGHIDLQLAVSGLTIDAQHHLHIYLDGQIAAMGYSTTVALDNVPPGIHDICVVVANVQHLNSSLEDGIQIVVEAAATKQP